MSRWMQAIAVVLALSTGLTVVPVSAQTGPQTEPVLFELRLARGETLYYDFAQSIKTSMMISGRPITIDVAQTAREAIRTLNVDPDGSMTVEVVLEDFRQTVGSQTQEVLVSPVTLTIHPKGKVIGIDMTAPFTQLIKDVSFEIPDRPLLVGDSWTTPLEVEEQGIHIRGTATITLVAVELTSNGRVGHFRTNSEGKATGGNFDTLPPGFQGRFNGTVHGTGLTDWLVDRGRLLGFTQEVSVEGALEVTGQGQVIRGTMRVAISSQVQALVPESITAPAVSPNMLIAAGRGIGIYTIDQSVADLTSQLGSPTSITGDGNRPTVLTWPNGLRGHVAATEQNRLLSLQIGNDRRFRTDKGIGFGSSRGAVLTAYGLTPTRVELSGPEGTGVYVLIYNDEGIAFAIASAGPPVELNAERAPANTVAWITVFPPGGAEKILPLP